jgi:hypothetical protein
MLSYYKQIPTAQMPALTGSITNTEICSALHLMNATAASGVFGL